MSKFYNFGKNEFAANPQQTARTITQDWASHARREYIHVGSSAASLPQRVCFSNPPAALTVLLEQRRASLVRIYLQELDL
jgi:hypothetical protein